MASSVTVSNIRRIGNRLYVQFADGEELEFGSRREAIEHARSILDDVTVTNILKAILIARGVRLAADADTADDLDLLIGKTITFNRAAVANIVRIV